MLGSFWFPGYEQEANYGTSQKVTFALAHQIRVSVKEDSPPKAGYLQLRESDVASLSLKARGDIGQVKKSPSALGITKQEHVTMINLQISR